MQVEGGQVASASGTRPLVRHELPCVGHSIGSSVFCLVEGHVSSRGKILVVIWVCRSETEDAHSDRNVQFVAVGLLRLSVYAFADLLRKVECIFFFYLR